MFTEIKGPADGLKTSLNAVRLVSKGPADGLENSSNYAYGHIYSLLKLGVLQTG